MRLGGKGKGKSVECEGGREGGRRWGGWMQVRLFAGEGEEEGGVT